MEECLRFGSWFVWVLWRSRLVSRARNIHQLKVYYSTDPLNLLYDKERRSSWEHSDILAGISPSNRFEDRCRLSSFGSRRHMSQGRVPDKLLSERARVSMFELLKIKSKPLRLSYSKFSILKLLRFPISPGIFVCRGLKDRFRVWRVDMLEREGGVKPVKLLFPSYKSFSLGKKPNHAEFVHSNYWTWDRVLNLCSWTNSWGRLLWK